MDKQAAVDAMKPEELGIVLMEFFLDSESELTVRFWNKAIQCVQVQAAFEAAQQADQERGTRFDRIMALYAGYLAGWKARESMLN